MNTIGKILVILNFLFAIVVGILIVMNAAVRTKLHDVLNAQKNETIVLAKSRDTTHLAVTSIANDYRSAQGEIETLGKKLKDADLEKAALEASLNAKIEELNLKVKDADLSLRETLKSKQRLVDEVAELNKSIKDRETLIVKLDADVKNYRIIAVNNESQSKTKQIQNELLLEQVRELTAKLARAESGAGGGGSGAIEGGGVRTSAYNPPAVKVSGKIERVDAVDNSLVEISLGTDHGVSKNHTLDVFRFHPEVKYLGTIRIVEAFHHKSVGRLMSTGGAVALRPQLKAGDQVSSSITK